MKIPSSQSIVHGISISLLALLMGCASFPVVIKRDPFKKGADVITADMWHSVVDSRIDNTRVVYEKTINNGIVSDPSVTFEFVARVDPYYYDYHGENFKSEAYVLADDAQFTVPLVSSENVKLGMEMGHAFFSDVVINTDTRRMLIAKIRLTPEIQQAIEKSKIYMIRFYLGDIPLTLQATTEQLEAVKKFIRSGEESGLKSSKQ